MQADVERFLARLLTDPALRERFLADRAGVAKQAGLSPEETEAMARMPSQDLRTAARSYQHKRDASVQRGGRNWLAGLFRRKRR
jgi:pantoate kinase